MCEFVWPQEIVYKMSAHIREPSSAYIEKRKTHTAIIKVGAGYSSIFLSTIFSIQHIKRWEPLRVMSE